MTNMSQNNNKKAHCYLLKTQVFIKSLSSTCEEENYGIICVMELYTEIIVLQSFQQEKWPSHAYAVQGI